MRRLARFAAACALALALAPGAARAQSVDRLVAASADDGQQIGTTVTLNGTTIGGSLDATTDWIIARFTNIGIPRNATITAATFSVVPSATTEDEPSVTVYLEASDSCAQPTTGASNISNRTRTSGVSWSSTDLAATGASYHSAPSLVTQVQAVVDRAGWASGGALCVIVQGGASSTRDLTVEAYDLGPGTNPPRLQISYTVNASATLTGVAADGVVASVSSSGETGGAPPAIEQTVANQETASTTTIAATLASNVASGNYLWAVARSQGDTAFSISGCSATWTSQGSTVETPGTNSKLEHWTAPLTSSGSCTVTVTYAAAQTNRGVYVAEVSGVSGVQASDEQMGHGDNVSPTLTASVSTAPAFSMAVGNSLQGGATGTPSTGWTDEGLIWSPTIQGARVASRSLASTGDFTLTFPTPSFDRFTGVLVVLTAGGGGGGTDGNATVTGTSAAGVVGSVSSSVADSSTLTGVAAEGVVGSVSATGGGSASSTLTGVAATGAPGSVSASGSASVTLQGSVAGAGVVGTVSAAGGSGGSASPSGVAAAGAVGTVSSSGGSSRTLTGVAASGAVGSVTSGADANGSATLTGTAATGLAGTVGSSGSASASIASVAGSGFVGSVSSSGGSTGSASPSGVAAAGAVASVSASVSDDATLSGVTASASVGSVTARVDAGAVLTTVVATAAVHSVEAGPGDVSTLRGIIVQVRRPSPLVDVARPGGDARVSRPGGGARVARPGGSAGVPRPVVNVRIPR